MRRTLAGFRWVAETVLWGFPILSRVWRSSNTEEVVRGRNEEETIVLNGTEASPPADAVVNKADRQGRRLLHHAAGLGDLDRVRFLVEELGADIDAADRSGNTALHLAGEKGHADTVRYLLRAGANINAVGDERKTVLHLAAENGHGEIVRALVEEFGSDVNAKASYQMDNERGDTPLHLAARSGYDNIVRLLVESARSDVNAVGIAGTPLHYAAGNGQTTTVEMLLSEMGADLGLCLHSCRTALDAAVEEGYDETVRVLLRFGAGIETTSWLLYCAARGGYTETLRLLLDEAGADANIFDLNDVSLLAYAIEGGHEDTIRLLAGSMGPVDFNKSCQRLYEEWRDDYDCTEEEKDL